MKAESTTIFQIVMFTFGTIFELVDSKCTKCMFVVVVVLFNQLSISPLFYLLY